MTPPPWRCPRCASPLDKTRLHGKRAATCGRCHGHAVTLAAVRQTTHRADYRALWDAVRATAQPSTLPCPSCGQPLQAVAVPGDHAVAEVDLCQPCQVVWFDPGERPEAPSTPAPRRLDPEAQRAMALLDVHLHEERRRLEARVEHTTALATGAAPLGRRRLGLLELLLEAVLG